MAPDLGSPRTALHLGSPRTALHLGSPRTAPDPARPRATPRRAPLALAAVFTLALALALAPAGPAGAAAAGRAPVAPSYGTHRTGSTAGPVEKLYGAEVRRIPTTAHTVALTFNAAWDEQGLATVLEVLRQQDAPATFFLTGQFAERHPAAARTIAAARQGIANHSYSHAPFGKLTPAQRAGEITRADRAIREATGIVPLPFFRFPYGDTTPEQIAEVNRLGYADIEWTTDTTGYKGAATGMTVQKAVKRAVDALRPGAIIQMHVGSLDGQGDVLDAQALSQIIDAVRTRGYTVTSLNTLLTPA
ncbi:polysaccharide deacetylase family protein [Streptomyces sp. NBC_00083]|uniref:polysaccharide deacetylase family protein n=1 Tax=Streptomyces sp. NBC_00083 TaxID=2975647 RepID=UPI00225248A4|nr:polysaccharide deacetylase family protein [Streptomyces sp. NBC_00083]MCX5388159.1 polysaccharide deacetylase family protein [Streptomyces sp. NBC_00083]